MITKITDENRQSYNERFDLLNEKLSQAGFSYQIKNIPSLFANLNEIASKQENGQYVISPEYYAMLPVDEPFFEINANTRIITVPEAFKKNGISIQNDHLAEVVYFKIDRYFDRNDLANDTNIYIDWKMGSTEGRSIALWPTTAIDNGYIIFGWGIDQRLTTTKGTIQFAVRIESDDKDGDTGPDLIFNTLVASVNINAGININTKAEDFEVINVEDSIRARFLNSSYTPESFEPLRALAWGVDGDLPTTAYFELGNESEANSLELAVTLDSASIESDENFTFYWSQQGGSTISHSSDNVSDSFSIVDDGEDGSENKYYYVRAQGRRTISKEGGEEFYQTTGFLRSNVCQIPKAAAPSSVVVDIIPANSSNFEETDDYIFIPSSKMTNIKARTTVTFDKTIKPGRVSFEGLYRPNKEAGHLSEGSFDGDSEVIWGNNNDQTFVFEETINVNDSGRYEVKIENMRNHTKNYSEIVESKMFKTLASASDFTANSLVVTAAEDGIAKEHSAAATEVEGDTYQHWSRKASIPTEITADLNINTSLFNLDDCEISYKWIDLRNNELSNNKTYTIEGSSLLTCRCIVNFKYCDQDPIILQSDWQEFIVTGE